MWKVIRIVLAILLLLFAAFLMLVAYAFTDSMLEGGMVRNSFDVGHILAQLSLILATLAYMLNFKSKTFFILFVIFIIVNILVIHQFFYNISSFITELNLYR